MAGKGNMFQKRLEKHHDELRWLYMELYGNDDMFAELCSQLYEYSEQRSKQLKKMDESREKDPNWYKKNDILGMMMYIDNYAGNLKGVEEKLDYLEECQVNYIHLMPFLDTPKGRSDGGYAVSDFRKVQPQLGTMEDLESLTQACHKRGMNVCMDFVMNHTSEDHEWAVRARHGEGEYMSRYFFYHDYSIPSQYEKTVPQVFPTTAPGNFTWLQEAGHFVMTTFYPYQWDLNYRNPRVFNEMVYNFLFLANKGIDVMRIDAVPYIWKELGTNCRNLPQVHSIVRMMRMICEIVCPGVLLLGEVVMEPEKVVPYFGTVEKPECHMLYNVTTMASTWHTVATGDTRLLKLQMDIVSGLPKEYVFLNYLRCHDDIGWGLDYGFLKQFGMNEVSHKKYLNDFLTGAFPEAFGRGELYNSDPTSGDARLCGTTASLCGIEKAAYERNDEALAQAVRLDLMLHAYMLTQSGIPVIYSGDEIGQENDYTYHEEPDRWGDSRYLHRGRFRWDLEAKRSETGTVQEKLFNGIGKLEQIRKGSPVFHTDAQVHTIDTRDDAVLGIVRENAGQKLTALFNFSAYEKTVYLEEGTGYTDLISGKKTKGSEVHVEGYGACWLVE
jgi:amylosucrase